MSFDQVHAETFLAAMFKQELEKVKSNIVEESVEKFTTELNRELDKISINLIRNIKFKYANNPMDNRYEITMVIPRIEIKGADNDIKKL